MTTLTGTSVTSDPTYRVFQAIAGKYDRTNCLVSLGMHKKWQRKLVRKIRNIPHEYILDVACGTGALTEQLACLEGVHVTGIDPNDAMLAVAKKRHLKTKSRQGRCRTGKIMKYNRETGRRVKDENVGGKITWVHSILKKSNNPKLRLPNKWELTQCLFGEHLLKQYPFKNVAIVESEKTAVICSFFWSEYIWLATGGKSQLNDRLQVLKGRKIVAFPDVDGYQEWKEKLSQVRGLDIMVSDVLEKNATQEDRNNHVDIADLLIRQHRKEHILITPVEERRDPIKNPAFLKMKELLNISNEEELALLIDDLGLEMVGVKKI